MAAPADAIYLDGDVRPLANPDGTVQALAIRDGRCCRLADSYEVAFLEGIETDSVDLAGRTVLPGFEAHRDLLGLGQRAVRADLSGVGSREAAIEAMQADATQDRAWVLGVGYDTAWAADHLDRTVLDAVSEDRPVAAIAADGRDAVLNAPAAERVGVPAGDDGRIGSRPTAVLRRALGPATVEAAREYVEAALDFTARRGVTTLHATVEDPTLARAVWERDTVSVRLRLHYRGGSATGLGDAARRLGLVSGAGGPRRSIETIGARVAAVKNGEDGPWIAPGRVPAFLETTRAAGLRTTLYAMDEQGLDAAIEAFAGKTEQSPRLVTEVAPAPAQLRRLGKFGTEIVLGPGAWSSLRIDATAVPDPGRKLRFASGPFDVRPLGLLETVEERLKRTTALRVLTGTPAGAAGIAVDEPADLVVLSGSLADCTPGALDVDLTVSDGRQVAGSV